MDRYLGTPYWGDPGVPHGGNFFLVWCGAAAFSAVNAASSFMPKFPKQNSQDKALVSEQHRWKKALKKNVSYLSEKEDDEEEEEEN